MNDRILELERSGIISHARQRDFFDPLTSKVTLTVIGAGGIGSFFSVMAGKLGINKIIVYDGDYIEAHNMPNQFFPLEDFGHAKVESLQSTIEKYTVSEVNGIFERVTSDTELHGIVVSGVDSMAARKEIAEAVYKSKFKVNRYFDARIGGEKIVIYSVNPKNADQWRLYQKTLYSDEEAREDPCTRRSVIDIMAHVGAHLLTLLRRYISNEEISEFTYVDIGTNKIYYGSLENTVG